MMVHFPSAEQCCAAHARRAKGLIRALLEVDPNKRLTATQALQHEWITQRMDAPADLAMTRDKLRKGENRSRFKARACPRYLARRSMLPCWVQNLLKCKKSTPYL
jgi:serine/threonine protein kinase